MSASAAKLVYGLGLLFLAAFVVMPTSRSREPNLAAPITSMSAEDRLARAIQERISAEAASDTANADLATLRAQEDGLRRLAFADDEPTSRADLIDALADALSAAMLSRAALSADHAHDASAIDRADTVVRRLTAAINAEVRGLAT